MLNKYEKCLKKRKKIEHNLKLYSIKIETIEEQMKNSKTKLTYDIGSISVVKITGDTRCNNSYFEQQMEHTLTCLENNLNVFKQKYMVLENMLIVINLGIKDFEMVAEKYLNPELLDVLQEVQEEIENKLLFKKTQARRRAEKKITEVFKENIYCSMDIDNILEDIRIMEMQLQREVSEAF